MKKWLSFSLLLSVTLVNTTSYSESLKTKNMVYLYGSNSDTYEKQLEKTQGLIGTIAPDYFHLSPDGNLVSTVDSNFVQTAKQKGYTVTPFISNDWNQSLAIKAMESGDKLADDLYNAVISNNLDGVDIDIENLTPAQKQQQTAFVKRLTDKLHAQGKTVSIAVPPITGETTNGWAGSYDYQEIGKIVDTVFIMGYDYSYPSGPNGPVAPLTWVENSVHYMVTKIPPEKMILGVPFYGRYWNNQQKGGGIYYPQAVNLVDENNGSIRYDAVSSSMVANLSTVKGPTEIWFDNAQTLKQKIQLVNKYHLAGWGGWHLGQEDPQLWTLLKDNVPYFWDISGHWAQNDIINMNNQDLLSGYENYSFQPEQNITREEVASLLVRVMKLSSQQQMSFTDVAKDRWSYSSINTMAANGMMSGYPDSSFKPNQPITRGELASVLNRCFPTLPMEQSVSPVVDINQHWAKLAIINLQKAGIARGYDDGTFRPDRAVTRAEAAAMVWRIIGNKPS
jgi:spore germination protein YaaH